MRQREVTQRFCPNCGGVFFRDHPGGVLECMHRYDCGLLVAEDGTRAADHHRVMTTRRRRFRRPATAAERQLLAELGYPGDLTGLATSVDYVSSVRHRAWPNPAPTPNTTASRRSNTR